MMKQIGIIFVEIISVILNRLNEIYLFIYFRKVKSLRKKPR